MRCYFEVGSDSWFLSMFERAYKATGVRIQ
jgi:hypothetical protein